MRNQESQQTLVHTASVTTTMEGLPGLPYNSATDVPLYGRMKIPSRTGNNQRIHTDSCKHPQRNEHPTSALQYPLYGGMTLQIALRDIK